jgi:protein-S-isoprenylcysteine O-methyltransferase Ste14
MAKIMSGISKPPTLVLLTALAVVFTLALAFATEEIPRLLNQVLSRHIPDIHGLWGPHVVEPFVDSMRTVGYVLIGVVIGLIIAGFVSKKRGLSSLGSIFLFLPTFGYFAAPMFFLAGLGILRVGWLPFEGYETILRLGDIVYVPYMIPVYIFELAGNIDIRLVLSYLAIGAGLFLFTLGTITWFYGKHQGKERVDFGIYKYSRHPQYLGFIIWSYGVMLLGALSQVFAGRRYPPVTLPWLISTLIIISVALMEEIDMKKKDGEGYLAYRATVPFLFHLPRRISSVVTTPIRILYKKDLPETGKQVLAAFAIYLGISMLLSVPFLQIHWPPALRWIDWPYLD